MKIDKPLAACALALTGVMGLYVVEGFWPLWYLPPFFAAAYVGFKLIDDYLEGRHEK